MLTKYQKGIEVTEKISVDIGLNRFKGEARDFNAQNIEHFITSSYFTKEFKLVGDKIKSVREI